MKIKGDIMKKIKKYLLENTKMTVAFIIGVLIGIPTVYAATTLFAANQVGYNNTTSGSSATNVQDAVDDLYARAKGQNDCKLGYTKQNENSTSYECRH